MEITDFDIKLNKANVLYAAGCSQGSAVYDTAAHYFDELYDAVISMMTPYAAFAIEDMRVYCALTAGGEVSDFIKALFDSGEAVKGLIADAMADEYLFETDKILTEKIRLHCAEKKLGIRARLDAPKDFPLSVQPVILEKTDTSRITVTDAFMLSPVKSMAYILELTDDEKIFNAQHDCRECKSVNCPRRRAPYKGEITSYYVYAPPKTDISAVCVDIGTTTIAMQYISNGEVKKTYKALNPQRRFGADVLSRIEAANRGRGDELNSLIHFALKKGIGEITDGNMPDKIIAAGNTTMVHLLMNYPCTTLGEYPFKSDYLDTAETTFDAAHMTILGGISAFVGGDIVSGLYMCGFDVSEQINLYIDLGTNGEIAIGNKGRILATSAPAGPAFEGGRISCGINGTDIIKIIADMLENKIIDTTGKMADKYFKTGYKLQNGVTVVQNDIREIQMAKSAVRAGVECLINAYGVKYEDICTVYLAGGMGYYLSPESAARTGLLPPELAAKTTAAGNASLGGCVKYACEGGAERIEHIRSVSRDFTLAKHKDFERLYMEYMNF